MRCSGCASNLDKAISKLPGINHHAVNLLKNSLTVDFDEQILSIEKIIATVHQLGFEATLVEDTTSPIVKQNANVSTSKSWRLIISFIFLLPLVYLSMSQMAFSLPLPDFFLNIKHSLFFAITQLLLLIPIVFVNISYYQIGFKTLFKARPNMDSLVAISSSAAIIFGIYTIYKIQLALLDFQYDLAHQLSMNMYFESAGMILTLITLGKYLEDKTKKKTSSAITKLMKLTPPIATRLINNREETISIDKVQLNDILIVKAGSSIPVDGIITQGHGVIDESAITGESIPSEKTSGQKVIGGTINQSGYFQMKVTKIGKDTTLAQIINLVNDATSSKAPIAKLADTISGYFVPIIITLALITTITWLLLGQSLEFALSIGICVLVISCPCALGLATPTAIMVGSGKGAVNGILIKSAQALEQAKDISSIILDKTGTITQGKPTVTDIFTLNNTPFQHLLSIAFSLEKLSAHPLSFAISQTAKDYNISSLSTTNFQEIIGKGLSGIINNKLCLAGNQALLESNNISNPQAINLGKELSIQGKTPIYIVENNVILGIIALADTIKSSSFYAIKELQNLNINIFMLTGDNEITAKHIAQKLNISSKNVIANALPQDKEQLVRTLQQKGHLVAMVGDGINDAPALARSNVGIAIGAGTDIAIDSANIILMKNDLNDVVSTIKLSKAVVKNIKENLFWAFFYNIISIPIAMGIFYFSWGLKLSPTISALAMSFSSLFVVINALRLNLFSIKSFSNSNDFFTKTNTINIKNI